MYYPRSLELRSVCVVHNLGREFGLQESFKSKVAWPNGKAYDYDFAARFLHGFKQQVHHEIAGSIPVVTFLQVLRAF